jgi:general secretion pathway protein B
MSFILDALKKSEADRQQHSGSEFADVPTSPQPASVPRWLWVVGLLLAINLLVLISLLLRPDSPTSNAVTPMQHASTAANAAAVPIKPEPPPSFKEQVASARSNPPVQQPEVAAVEARANTADPIQSVLISQQPDTIPASSLYPTMQEVRVRGTINLPDLHLDIHVFSLKPDDRFVFINMSKLREGSTLTEGPVVKEITPDGVVLRHEGQTFLLPRE